MVSETGKLSLVSIEEEDDEERRRDEEAGEEENNSSIIIIDNNIGEEGVDCQFDFFRYFQYYLMQLKKFVEYVLADNEYEDSSKL